MALISILAWARKHGIGRNHAYKLAHRGEIPAVKQGLKARYAIDEDFVMEVQHVMCSVCGAPLVTMTQQHLNLHGMSYGEYVAAYPDASTMGAGSLERLRRAGRYERTSETRQRMSLARKGVVPANHPRFVHGSWSPSDETRARMAAARTGKRHSEATKLKIGAAHRGVAEGAEARRKLSARMVGKESFFKGRRHTTASKRMMAQKAIVREAKLDKSIRREWSRRGGLYRPTAEQRKSYRAAFRRRLESGDLFVSSAAEHAIAGYLESWSLEVRRQWFVGGRPWDLYVPELNALVACDGNHHWNAWWMPDPDPGARLEGQMADDAAMNLEAGRAGYRVFRVRYRTGVPTEAVVRAQLEDQGFNTNPRPRGAQC